MQTPAKAGVIRIKGIMATSLLYVVPLAIVGIVALRLVTYYGVGAWMSQKNKG